MSKGFKIKPTPVPEKGPKPILAPTYTGQVPMGDDVRKITSPDGPRKGYTVEKSGARVFKDEKPYPPATPPDHKPYKVHE